MDRNDTNGTRLISVEQPYFMLLAKKKPPFLMAFALVYRDYVFVSTIIAELYFPISMHYCFLEEHGP